MAGGNLPDRRKFRKQGIDGRKIKYGNKFSNSGKRMVTSLEIGCLS